jgi:CubicO group peptidase (beta-lactamase class C family)
MTPIKQNQKDQDLEGVYRLSAEEMLAKLGQQPLAYQPGSTFEYSIATDVLGHVLERIEKKPLDQILSEQVLKPLGLKDTVWYLDAQMMSRWAQPSRQTLDKDPLAWVYTWLQPSKPPKRFSGGAGLASTTADVGRLLQMLVNGGAIDGVRLLSPNTVRYMIHTDHLDGVRGPNYTAGEGYGWSLVNPVRIAAGMHATPRQSGRPVLGRHHWPPLCDRSR